MDVFSPSIWAGWYGGGYYQYEDALVNAQKKYPRMLHMEYGGSSHVGRSNVDPPGGDGLQGGQVSVTEMVNQSGVVSIARYGDWSESYIVDLFDWHLKVSESLPNFGGNAQWAFKDFSTPLRPENPLPYINQKGLVDRQGRPKEAYWVFKSYWTAPVLPYFRAQLDHAARRTRCCPASPGLLQHRICPAVDQWNTAEGEKPESCDISFSRLVLGRTI